MRVSTVLPIAVTAAVAGLVASTMAGATSGQPLPTAHDDAPETRIVGGTQASEGEWPYAVRVKAMVDEKGGMVCGGTLISPDIVLTAQHCMQGHPIHGDIKFVYADIGQVDWKQAKQIGMRKRASSMRQVITGAGAKRGDWAVVKLDEKVWVSQYGTITMDATLDRNRMFRAIGWGRQKTGGPTSQFLMQVDLPLARDTQCSIAPDVEICAGGLDEGGKDTCQGDSGGPLFTQKGSRWVQVGITSWGIGCAKPKIAGHYTKISRFTREILGAIDRLGGMRPGTTIPKPPDSPAPTQPAPTPTNPAPTGWPTPTNPQPTPTNPAPTGWPTPTNPQPTPTNPAPTGWPTPTNPAPKPTSPAPPRPTWPGRPTWPNPFPGQPLRRVEYRDGTVWEFEN